MVLLLKVIKEDSRYHKQVGKVLQIASDGVYAKFKTLVFFIKDGDYEYVSGVH